MINVACVWIPPKYDVDYVFKLKSSVDRHLSKKYKFHVLTTHPQLIKDSNINVIPIAEDERINSHPRGKWWYKANLFAQLNWQGRVLYFDLDNVIIGNLDKLVEYETDDFIICQDFNRHGNPEYPVCNSSVMCFNANNYTTFFDKWQTEKDTIIRKYKGDQDWITVMLGSTKKWWPYNWVMSYKWEVLNGGLARLGSKEYRSDVTTVDPQTSVLVFHGKPNPDEVTDDIIVNNWK